MPPAHIRTVCWRHPLAKYGTRSTARPSPPRPTHPHATPLRLSVLVHLSRARASTALCAPCASCPARPFSSPAHAGVCHAPLTRAREKFTRANAVVTFLSPRPRFVFFATRPFLQPRPSPSYRPFLNPLPFLILSFTLLVSAIAALFFLFCGFFPEKKTVTEAPSECPDPAFIDTESGWSMEEQTAPGR